MQGSKRESIPYKMGPPRPVVRRSRRKARVFVNSVALTKKGPPKKISGVHSHSDLPNIRERKKKKEVFGKRLSVGVSELSLALSTSTHSRSDTTKESTALMRTSLHAYEPPW